MCKISMSEDVLRIIFHGVSRVEKEDGWELVSILVPVTFISLHPFGLAACKLPSQLCLSAHAS